MSELRDLYQDVILDHGKHPRNLREIADANRHATGRNPLCGDHFDVELKLDAAGTIQDAAFHGDGCAISVASASIMTELLKGKTTGEAEALFDAFHMLCTTDDAVAPDAFSEDDFTYLQVVAGVRQFPIRVKCATLAWHTMKAALDGVDTTTSDTDS
jgi:nitrogen fixation NifU-like protein